jgi:hypothetical protein
VWTAGSLASAWVASEAVEIIVTAKIAENSKIESAMYLSTFRFMFFTSIHFWSKNCLSYIENKKSLASHEGLVRALRVLIFFLSKKICKKYCKKQGYRF